MAQTEDDGALKPAEPDFTLVSLPTSLRLPALGSAFRVTHRFVRPLNCEFCADSLLEDLLGIDSGALIGLEFRLGVVPGGQIALHRAREGKTIDLYGQYGLLRQSADLPLDLSVRVGVEGTNNFRDEYSPTVTLVASRLFGEVGGVYLEPIWVGNSNVAADVVHEEHDHGSGTPEHPHADEDDQTFLLGVGGRVRIRPTVYVVGEFSPRLAGFKPGAHHGSIGIEKRAGGHLFQVNFSTSFATTPGALARGGIGETNWYMGFNISRKFY
jgi:hypothetical protein